MRAVSPPGFSRGFYAIRLYEKERKRYIYMHGMNAVVVILPEEFLFHGSECFTTRHVTPIEDIFSLERNTMKRVLHLFEWIGYLRRLMADGISAIFTIIGMDRARKDGKKVI